MGRQKQRPGIMIYFEDYMPVVEMLGDAQLGSLFRALMQYAATGAEPEAEMDGVLRMVYGMLKPKLDRDEQAYRLTCLKRQYAVYCREQDRNHLARLSFEDWRDVTVSDDADDDTCDQNDPIPNPNSNTNSVSNSASETNTNSFSFSTPAAGETGCGGNPGTGPRFGTLPDYTPMPQEEFERRRAHFQRILAEMD